MRFSVLLWLAASFALAQPAKPSFEVVSVKATSETWMELVRSGRKPIELDDAQAVYRAAPLSLLIQAAYRLPQDQIAGPGWMGELRFNVTGKLSAGAGKDQAPEMLQAMLAERFKLVAHYEERTRAVYLLVLGKGPLRAKKTAGGDPTKDGCQGGRGGHHDCQNMTMDGFADYLSMGRAFSGMAGTVSVWPDRPVVNKTGVDGAYDFPFDFGCVGVAGRGCRPDDAANFVPAGDAVRTLGLAFESGKAPYKVLVIDHVEQKPTDN